METVRSLFKNSTFSIITNTFNRLGNAVIFILVVQFLGVEKAGIYTIGVSYFFIASRFAFWGLDHLLTREVAKAKNQATKFISNYFFIRLVLATLAIFITLFIVQAVPYQSQTKLVISIMILSIWPENINNLCWAAFAAFEEFHFTSISVFFGSLIQIVLGVYFLWQGYDVVAMAVVFLINNLVALTINVYVLNQRYISKWELPDRKFVRDQLKVSLPFVFIGVFFILDNRLDTIILSFLTEESVVGLYTAATAVIVALSMIPQGYRIAILPVLARYRSENPAKVQNIYDQSYRVLSLIGLPLSAATGLLSGGLIRILYGENLPTAVPTLQIMSVTLFLTFINVLNTRLLIVYDKQSLTARYLLITTIFNAAVNFLLAPQLGAVGAGIARLGSNTLLFLLNTIAIRDIVKNQTKPSHYLKTLICTIGMSFAIWFLQPWGFWLQVSGGSIVYVILVFSINILSPEEKGFLASLLKSKNN